ncbi:hypothetical protein C8Q80DRAFT_1108466, partial [Daedaleopsis nitida]
WIKPKEQCHGEQRVAHLIVTLCTPEAANQAIQEGLNIEGKSVLTRKLLWEPRNCMKHQEVGAPHIAATCPATTDVCGTCAGGHCTLSCTVKEKHRMCCCNCKIDGHAAWDRACPSFVAALACFNEKTPLNHYRFYPTGDPSTWVLLDNKTDTRNTQHSAPSNDAWGHPGPTCCNEACSEVQVPHKA